MNSDIHQQQTGTSRIQFFLDKQEPCSHRTFIMCCWPLPQVWHTRMHDNCYKFLVSTHNLGFRILGFIIESNGEARRRPAKKPGVLAMDWFPVCGILRRIIACRLNFDIRIGEEHSIHFSEKAIEPCISNVEKAQYAEFNVPTCEHPLKPPMLDWDAKTM